MSRRALLLLLVILSATLAVPSAAQARGKRADLVVRPATLSVTDGAITGRFVVANRGRRKAGRSTASLALRGDGRRRVLERFRAPKLRRGATRKVRVTAELPDGLAAGAYRLQACADAGGALKERDEDNNCRTVGRVDVPATSAPAPAQPGGGTPAPAPVPPPAGPVSTVPTAPVPYTADTTFKLGGYWISVPAAYDASHKTPAQLLVWSHGCGGQSEFDVDDVKATGGRGYVTIAADGRENGCWDVEADPARLLAAIADVETHFNIDRRRIVLGGYSSGGDLSYRTAFYNSRMISGVIAENTSPFRDTGSSQSASIAAATFKFPVVHVAHTEDDVYPIDGVRSETDALTSAGFAVTRVERPGQHYDANTVSDLKTLGLTHMDDGWLSPGG